MCLVDALLRAICYHFLHPVDPGKENVGPSGRAFGLSAPVEVRLRKEDGTLSTRCYQGTVAAYAKDGSYTVLLATDAVVTGVLESHLQLPGTQEQQQRRYLVVLLVTLATASCLLVSCAASRCVTEEGVARVVWLRPCRVCLRSRA